MVNLRFRLRIHAPIERCFDLARSIEVHLLENIHSGRPARVVAGRRSGLAGEHDSVTWRARHFLLWHSITSEITIFQPPVYFQDTMRKGIFRFMQHGHYFRPLPSGETEMEDVFSFSAPVGPIGRLAEILFLQRYMSRLLVERCMVIKRVAESDEWRRYLPENRIL